MSRFDDFAKSRAEGHGFFSSFKRTRPSSEFDGDAGVSRRDLMKKAGLVTGAAVVGSTLIQSVTAPAYATSHCTDQVDAARGCGATCPTLCPNTSSCLSHADCASGVCTGLVCEPPTASGACVLDSHCDTGQICNDNEMCEPTTPTGAPESLCHGRDQATADSMCAGTTAAPAKCAGWSATSTWGRCRTVDGGVCVSDTFCASGNCDNTAPAATFTCLKSPGASCTQDDECAQNLCRNGVCSIA